MARVFQVFRERAGDYRAIGTGPAWAGVPLPWAWALAHRLWLRGVGLLAVDVLVALLAPALLGRQPIALALVCLVPRIIVWVRGSSWLAAQMEILGCDYLGEIVARSRAEAVAQVARHQGRIAEEFRPRLQPSSFPLPPPRVQQLWAIARLTLRAAFRYRLVVVLIALLVGAVVVLPLIIKHDGTAQGFTQILLTYTLGISTALLSLVTLWLACGTLARDVDECQMQVVVTKPIPRWQVWLGKWIGIMLLNAMLFGVAAGAVFLLMQWRATQLPVEIQAALRNKVLTARAAVREPATDYDSRVEALVRERLTELQANSVNLQEFRKQAREVIKARDQLVPPDHFRRYRLDFRGARKALQGKPIFVGLKFYTPALGAKRPYEIEVAAGPPESAERRGVAASLVAEAHHELEIEAGVLDPEGYLVVDVMNRSDTPLIFSSEDGFEVLYREGGFGLNFVRAVLVILCWLGLLAAIGLAAASFLSFPVAAFLSTTVLILGLSTGTLKTVVEDQTVLGMDHDTNQRLYPAIDALLVPVFKLLLDTVNLVQQFSPIEAVSSGRSITWATLAYAVTLVIGLMGGAFAAIGIVTFTRRELATAQSHL